MPYTNIWNENAPPGSTDPRLIDNIFRGMKVDWRERLNSIIGVAIDTPLTDPVVAGALSLTTLANASTAHAGTIGSVAGRSIILPWYGVRKAEAGTITIHRNYYRVTGASASGGLLIAVPGLRLGNVITGVSVAVVKNSTNHTLTMNFYEYTALGDNTITNIASPGNSATAQWVDSAAMNLTVAAGSFFGFEIDAANNNMDTSENLEIRGVRVFYTSESAAQR